MTTGLLIDGELVQVPGLTVIPPASHGGPAYATARLAQALCRALGIPEQIPIGPYAGAPLMRMLGDGGGNLCGVIGHRDNTSKRGRGDPWWPMACAVRRR